MYRGVVGTSGYKPAKTALKNIEFPKYYETGLHPLHIEVEGVRRGSPGPIYGSGFTLNGAAALAIGLVLHCIAKGGPGDHVRAVWSLFSEPVLHADSLGSPRSVPDSCGTGACQMDLVVGGRGPYRA